MQCLDRPARGAPSGAIPTARIRPPSWWERRRGQRPRTVSQAAHPTVITPVSAGKKRIRTPSQVAPSGASTSGRSARPSGVVPPNQRMQPDAVPASEIGAILRGIRVGKAFPIDLAARLMRRPLGGGYVVLDSHVMWNIPRTASATINDETR